MGCRDVAPVDEHVEWADIAAKTQTCHRHRVRRKTVRAPFLAIGFEIRAARAGDVAAAGNGREERGRPQQTKTVHSRLDASGSTPNQRVDLRRHSGILWPGGIFECFDVESVSGSESGGAVESTAGAIGGKSERCSWMTYHRLPRFSNTAVHAPLIVWGSLRGVRCGT